MKVEQLTFTRFLAAISIVVFHYGEKSFVFNNECVGFLFKQADIAVSYFFVLSGFVMILAYGDKSVINTLDYFKNRFARIYPIYLFGIVLVLFGQILTKNIDFVGLVLNLFMIQAWFPSKVLSFNSPGWSLSVELLFYIIFPFFLNSIYKKINKKKVLLLVVLLWVASQLVLNIFLLLDKSYEVFISKEFMIYNPLMHINGFLVGNVAGLYFLKELKDKKRNLDFSIVAIIMVIVLILKFPLGLNFHNGLLAIFFIPLLILLSLNNGLITKVFKNKFCVFLGEISFGIYILQYPIFSLISAYSVNKYFNIDNVTTVFFIRLFILIGLSAVTYVFIEKPIQIKIKNIKFSKKKGKFLSFNNELE
jgi:peptidoglycan/LPS O-acetylase OafA/YrhL